MKVAIYAGSFDPITRGHLEIINAALNLFDHVIIAIGRNASKKGLFTIDERINLIRNSISWSSGRITITSFDGLLVDYAKQQNVKFVVRGLRAASDFDAEFTINGTNRELADHIQTLYFMCSKDYMFVSSSTAKEIASYGGDVSWLVTPNVEEALKLKFNTID